MCEIAMAIVEIRDVHRDCARIVNAPREVEEINLHLAVEAERYLRRHERRCAECATAA